MSYPPAADLVNREVLQYLHENDNLESLLRFYTDVYAVQREFSREFTPIKTRSEPPADCIAKGRPLMADNQLIIPADLLRKLVRQMLERAGRTPEDVTIAVLDTFTPENITDFYSNPHCLSVESIEQFLSERSFSGGEQLELIALLIRMAVKLFFVRFAQDAEKTYSLSGWNKGVCPVCGGSPMLALLRHGDGARMLECGLCHRQWTFTRLACPGCGNINQDSLGFFYQKSRQNRRVYICNRCKFYVKTAILKDNQREMIPELEDAATLYLDILAHEEGFHFSGLKAGSH